MAWTRIPTGPFDLSGDPNPTLSNDLKVNENGIELATSLNNGSYSGLTIAADVIAVDLGELVYFNTAGPHYNRADNTSKKLGVGFFVKDDSEGTYVLTNGVYRNDSFNLTDLGAIVYTGVPGIQEGVTTTSPTTSGSYIHQVGFVIAENTLMLNPSTFYVRNA